MAIFENTIVRVPYDLNRSALNKMDSVDIASLIEQLDDNIDDLEDALAPLAKGFLSDTAGNLPLLDKAQLYVLITYAIESIIFCMKYRSR